jgi:hypothetical protein
MYIPNYSAVNQKEKELDNIPSKRLTYNRETGTHEVRVPVKKFIKGPIPLDWIARANALPGKAGAVGLALWFLVGVQGSRTVKLTGEVKRIAGCERKAVYRALDALQTANLIICFRRPGARPIVEVQG